VSRKSWQVWNPCDKGSPGLKQAKKVTGERGMGEGVGDAGTVMLEGK
jgi:hypothetical protein